MNVLAYKCRNSATFFVFSVVAFLVSTVPAQVFAQEAKPASAPAQPAGPATEESSKGVILIAAKEGTTKFSRAGKPLPADATEPNDALSEGVLIETGVDGKVTLLFSTGTVSTVGPSTKLTLKEFSQEKFDAAGRSMGELKEEPSLSNVKLLLDFGSLIVGTKKLNKESSFDIVSPGGTAGVRGTQFQVAQPAGGGFSLDVAESTVAFTPQGAAAPLPVSTGKGLDVAAGAAPVPRPIKPAVAQAITQTNAGAFALTANVSLNVVSAKMDEAEAAEGGSDSEEGAEEDAEEGAEEAGEEDAEEGSEEGAEESGEEGGEEGSEEGSGEEGTEDSGGEDSGTEDSGAEDSGAEDSGGGGEDSGGETGGEGGDAGGDAGGGDAGGGDAGGGASATPPVESPPVDNAQVLENNPEVKEGRKEGKIDERTKQVFSLELTQKQSTRFYAYPDAVQNFLLAETPDVAQRLLDLNPPIDEAFRYFSYADSTREKTLSLLPDDYLATMLATAFSERQLLDLLGYVDAVREKILAEPKVIARRLMDIHILGGDAGSFYGYDADLRQRILQLEKDESVSALLRKNYDPNVMFLVLSDENLMRFHVASGATATPLSENLDEDLLGRAAVFVAESHANGNDFLLDRLLDMGQGTLTADLLSTGEEANRLLRDRILVGDISSEHVFVATSLASNPFYVSAASVWKQVSADHFPDAVAVALAGREVKLLSGNYSYASLLGDADTLLVSASSFLDLEGSISFSGPTHRSTRVVLAGGGAITASPGTTLDVALADLAMASRHDLTLREVALSAGGKVYLNSLRDMLLDDVGVQATDEVRLQALRSLSVDNLRFSEELRAIHMRATTLDLSNLDFPAQAAVRLESLKGGMDGKYPTFGTPNRGYGRVNFLENVRSGGNTLIDRSSFDLHGKNISIGKIPGR
jgi:hypothetical protein